MKFLLSIFLLLIIPRLSTAQEKELNFCRDLKNDCQYYSCIEAELACGKKGYPIKFGKKYCLKFERHYTNFSPRGKNWVDKTRECLISKIGQSPLDISCKDLKNNAFLHHVPCYVDSGYCELEKEDRKVLFKVVKGSLWRKKILKSIFKVKHKCKSLRTIK